VKEVLDIVMTVGFVLLLFWFINGMNKNQIQKHKDKLGDK